MNELTSYSVIVELTDSQVVELHNLVEFEEQGKSLGVIFETARQAALGIPKPFYPDAGDWVMHGEEVGRVVGKTSDADSKWIVEFEVKGENRYEVRQLTQYEIAPY